MDPNSYILSYLEKHLDSPALWLAATFYETCVWRNVLFLQYHIYADGSPLNFSGAVSYSYLRECFQAIILSESESRSVMSNSLRPHGLYTPWNSPGQNTGVGSLSLLQWIFPTQGLNPGLLHCRQIPYQLSHKGSPHKSPNKTATHISHMVYFYFSQHIRMGKIPKHWGHICVLLPFFFFLDCLAVHLQDFSSPTRNWTQALRKRICLPVQETQETWVQSLGQEDPLEQKRATHSCILA